MQARNKTVECSGHQERDWADVGARIIRAAMVATTCELAERIGAEKSSGKASETRIEQQQ
jgi:hypothetical protein